MTRSRAGATRGRPERYYVGRRPGETEVYVISGTEIRPLEHLCHRSSAPFDWGAPTEGGLELAYAVLVDATESRPPEPICQAFWTGVVAGLDRSGFVLECSEIALWLFTSFRDREEPPPRPGSKWRDRLRRIRPWERE